MAVEVCDRAGIELATHVVFHLAVRRLPTICQHHLPNPGLTKVFWEKPPGKVLGKLSIWQSVSRRIFNTGWRL